MTATLHQFVGGIKTLNPSKSHWDISHFAESLKMTLKETNSFIACIEKGGTGNKKDGSRRSNPGPFSAKINLTQNEAILLNLHYTGVRKYEFRQNRERSMYKLNNTEVYHGHLPIFDQALSQILGRLSSKYLA